MSALGFHLFFTLINHLIVHRSCLIGNDGHLVRFVIKVDDNVTGTINLFDYIDKDQLEKE